MKVTITHLKAPWPAGAKPGDVVELQGSAIPGWALGKCKPAADDAKVTAKAEAAAKPAKKEAPAADDAKVAKT